MKFVISCSSAVPASGAGGGAVVVSAASGAVAPASGTAGRVAALAAVDLDEDLDPPLLELGLELPLETDLIREAETSVEPGGPVTGNDPPLAMEKL